MASPYFSSRPYLACQVVYMKPMTPVTFRAADVPLLEVRQVVAVVIARDDLAMAAVREEVSGSHGALPPFQLAMITRGARPSHDPSSEPLTR